MHSVYTMVGQKHTDLSVYIHICTIRYLLSLRTLTSDVWPPYASYLAIEIAEETTIETAELQSERHQAQGLENGQEGDLNDSIDISCDTTDASNSDTCSNNSDNDEILHKSTPRLWVRVIYNDKEYTLADQHSTWLPYDKFISILQVYTMTKHEYASTCLQASLGQGVDRQVMQDEVAATIGTLKSKM